MEKDFYSCDNTKVTKMLDKEFKTKYLKFY